MQKIVDPLTVEDFEKDSVLVISKVRIDSDGAGTFEELPDVKTYNININEENRTARFCSYSFGITCLNTDDRYNPLNFDSRYHGWLKQGRKIELYAGIAGGDPYQLILGRIDDFKLGKRAGEDICTISGRCLMRMILDFKLYSPYTYWGASHTYSTEINKIRYNMEEDEEFGCKGVYRVFLDSTPPYDGSHFEEIYENTDWSYDWHNNQLVFTPQRIPDFTGENNLKVYYFQEQSVENVVADILIGSGILQAKIEATTISFLDNGPDPDTILDSNNGFVTAGFRSGQIITVDTDSGTNDGTYTISTVTPGVITLIASDELITENAATAVIVTITTDINLVSKTEWLASSSVLATNKKIKRVWFVAGISALKAITLLAEVVLYRFYFDYAGNPIFKPKPSAGTPVNLISHYEAKTKNIEENIEEVYTNIIVIGEERDRILGEDEIAPDVPTGLSLSTGLGLPTQASLAWIKAEWEANTESDFGHYELRIRKTAYSYFTEVSTIAISFIWYVLEPGVEYGVQIRAVDIYNNRSAWSTEVTQITATDTTTPDKIIGVVASALLAGIKVTWDGATEGDIAGYIIERQESENGITWTGDWIERARINATMWLDLLLTYATYYRYRIKAYTQTGVEGTASVPTADSIKPNQAGSDDIVFNAITGDHIAVNKLDVISADMGTIVAGTITLNTTGFIRSAGKTYDSAIAGFWQGYHAGKYKVHIGTLTEYFKWDGTHINLKGGIIITGGSGIASLTDAGALATEDDVSYGEITGTKPPSNADYFAGIAGDMAYQDIVEASKLGTTIVYGGYLRTDIIRVKKVYVGGGTNEDIYFEDSGVRLYDAGSRTMQFYKSGYATFSIGMQTDYIVLYTSGSRIALANNVYTLTFYNTGTLRLPTIYSAPSGGAGYFAYNSADDRPTFRNVSAWRHWTGLSGW